MTFTTDPQFLEFVNRAQLLFESHWFLAVLLFCALHLISSSLSIPGGCTVLNLTAGWIFGFALACLIVYPITIASAGIVYSIGRSFSGRPLAGTYQKIMARISERLGRAEFLFLVSLRLSPFPPYGPLNFMCGWLRVPFGLFLMSTTVGIFFDVILLTSLGAAARAGIGQAHGRPWMYVAFSVLLAGFWLARSLLFKEKERARL